jgi:hypothetical protein
MSVAHKLEKESPLLQQLPLNNFFFFMVSRLANPSLDMITHGRWRSNYGLFPAKRNTFWK